MAVIKVSDVAKKLGIPAGKVIKKLEEIGVFVNGEDTPLKPDQYVRVIELITGKKLKRKAPAGQKAPEGQETKEKEQQEIKKEAAPVKEPEKRKAEEVKTKEEKPEAKHPEETTAEAGPAKEKTPAATSVETPEEKPSRPEPEKKAEEIKAKEPSEKQEAQAPKAEEKKPQPEKKEAKAPAAEAKAKETQKPQAASKAENKEAPAVKEEAKPASAFGKTGITKRQMPQQEAKAPVSKRGSTAKSGDLEKRPRQQGEARRDNRQDGRSQDGRSQDSRQTGRARMTKDDSRMQQDRRQNKDAMQGFNKDKDKDQPAARRSQPSRTQQKRTSSADSYDMGLSQPSRHEEAQTSRQVEARKNDQKRSGNKKTGSEEYKNKKKNLIQEASFLDDDHLARHKKKPTKRPGQNTAAAEEEEIKIVALPESMTVKELADMLHKPLNVVIKSLMGQGIMAGLNQIIEYDTAEAIATEMDILVEHQVEEDIFEHYANVEDPEESLVPRSPVVVVMGHVDHGKTSLLDAIRNTNVTAREAGGITQHIGASVVTINGKTITFLDTPGHEAFTAMRMRGAQVTDIAILVVAADDGVMPQTIEAINHAKAANVQIIVAINKMDKPGANPDRVKQELTEYGLIAEEWGGSTICVPVSAINHEGIDTLLEMVLLVADMQELKANPNRLAVGTVIESELDKGRGAVATVLVQKGKLHVGDPIVAGACFGRVKAMTDDKGRRVKEAGPSMPVEITGLSEVPSAGDTFYMTENDREARLLAEKVAARERIKLIEGNKKVNLNDLFGDIQAGNVKELNILVKADVQGSVEAVKQSLEKLSNDQVAVKVIHGAVGGINESDVMLAAASNSIIIGFNVRPDATAKSTAEEQKVDIRLYRVIYNAIDDITAAMKGMLEPEFEEKIGGHATVRQIFHASGLGTIAGSYVTDGKITRGTKVRLLRDNVVIYEGEMSSLRRFKDDVREVATGYECGIMLEKFNDIKEGDVIEAFSMVEIKRD